jgi:peptidyl-prolyl cis-trans isomerase C
MRRKQSFGDLLATFVGLVTLACCLACTPPQSEQAEEQQPAEAGKVVAVVDGEPIYEAQLRPEIEKALRRFGQHHTREQAPDLFRRLQSRALDKAIGEELILQASQELVIEDVDERVEQKLEAMKRRYATEEHFEDYLERNGLTMEGVRSSLRMHVYVDEYLREKGLSEPQIPEQRIRETYERDRESYSREESVEVSHILIAVDATAESEGEGRSRQEAERIRTDILEGEDFAEMAKRHSDCNSASGGGNLGYIKKGYMPEEFETVAFSMEVDGVSEVVKTRFGYHVISVSDKKSAGIAPYEDVRDFIEKYLQQQETEKALAAHIAELREKAEIETFLE